MMSEEPNKSEEMLQRYAKERREQAGDFSLHPATRRLLQGEVTRVYVREKSASAPTGVWGWWRTRLLYAGFAFTAALTAGLVLLNQYQERRTVELAQAGFPARGPEPELRRNLQRQESDFLTAPESRLKALADTEAASDNMPAPAAPAPTAAVGERRGEIATLGLGAEREMKLSEVREVRPVTAPPPAVRSRGAIAATTTAPAVGSAPVPKRVDELSAAPSVKQESENLNFFGAVPPQQPASAPSKPLNEAVASTAYRFSLDSDFDTAAHRGYFARLAPDGTATQAMLPVLRSFSIEHTGAVVRIIDADGSLYEGGVEQSLASAEKLEDLTHSKQKDDSYRELAVDAQAMATYRDSGVTFRVTGSNITLRQPVIITGRMNTPVAGTPLREPAALGGRAGGVVAGDKLNSSTLAGLYTAATNAPVTLEGTVRVGATNQQWFRAVRQTR